MTEEKYSEWSKPELIKEIKKLKKRKKYGILWEDKPEKVADLCKEKLPILEEDTKKEIKTDDKKPVNILIEGDNYHALSVLNYTHKGKVDVIYIDPPYNTGNKSWKYNNNYVERDDLFKHSKWLSFMDKRLRLAKNLLKRNGTIIVAIDDYEMHALRLLMDEIFGENNLLAVVVVQSKPSGRTTDKFFAICHEYYLFYAKNEKLATVELFDLTGDQAEAFKYKDEISPYKWRDFLRTGGYSTPKERPNSFYPIYFNPNSNVISVEKISNSIDILPIDTKGKERVWRQTKPSLMEAINRADIKISKRKDGTYKVLMKDRIKEGRKPKTIWDSPKYDASTHGTKLLERILQKSRSFEFPKSVHAVHDALYILTKNKKDAVILDFFAGSGTTGHALLNLNKRDNGNRKFILCTNNEDNNGTGLKIATDICYPRIQKVIQNLEKESKGKLISNRPSGLKYFKTDFVDAEPTDKNKRKMVDKSTEMLCLKEDCFDEVKEGKEFRIFKNDGKHLGIIYDDDGIEPFKKEVKKLNKKFIVYVFSLDESAREEEFEDVAELVELKPIPAVILNVYKRIFK
ncbi:MAG: site-specific DNA-methyltransferase [Halobacteriota archaeon]